MKHLLMIMAAIALLSSCSTTSSTRAMLYPKMYEEKPRTILVMPPINNTNHAEAKEYFYSSMTKPLCEKGYYVISPFLALDLLKQESAYDSELFINGSLNAFRNVFGADAVLFTTIDRWEKQSGLSYIRVGIQYTLKSAKTGEILFNRKGDLTVNFSSGNNGILGLVADMVSTALTDKIVAARKCNALIFSDLPDGMYSPQFDKDRDIAASSPDIKGSIRN